MTQEKETLSDWLIASDIDGTLNDKRRRLCPRNYEAIQKFVYTYGGHFTLASGRSPQSMKKHFYNINIPKGKAIVVNGAGIYDFEKNEMFWSSPLNEHCIEMVRLCTEKFKGLTFQAVTENATLICNSMISARILASSAKLPIKAYKNFDEIPDKDKWLKVIFTGTPLRIKNVAAYIESMSNTKNNLMFSSIFSYEMVNEETNKGYAVLKLADFLGVDRGKTAAIGDYFNDYQMLKSVAFPACCGQAPQGMKDIAKLVTCHCNNGAVADLIDYIIENHNNI